MRSPLSANIYMEHFKQVALDSAPLCQKLWLCYIADTFVIWPQNKTSLALFTHLNGTREPIQFTMEQESEGQIPFLDVLVKRSGKWMSTSVCRKKTHTDRNLNFCFHHHQINLYHSTLAGELKNRTSDDRKKVWSITSLAEIVTRSMWVKEAEP